MGKKPRQWSPDGLRYLMVINPFGWRNPPDGRSCNVTPGHLLAWINHALGHQEGDSVVQELAWRAKTGTTEAILVGVGESVDVEGLLGEHRWSEFCISLTRPDSSYIFETKYESLTHACGADSWKRVESDLQPAGVGDMFKKPYPRPNWADSRKQCAGMNVQVSAQVKTMQALPQSELQAIKPDPSISQPPLVAASPFGDLQSRNNVHGPSHIVSTSLMPPTSAQTSQAGQGGCPSPGGAPSQGSSYVKREASENLVPVPRSTNIASTLSNTPSTPVLFSSKPEQPDNRHSTTTHGAADVNTSVSNAFGSGHEHGAPLILDTTVEVPEPRVKIEVSEGPVTSVEQATAAYEAYLAKRSEARVSIPTAAFTRGPSPFTSSAQVQSGNTRFSANIPPPSGTPETPTTFVRTEPLGRTFECASSANANPLVSVNLLSSGVSLPAAKFELTTTLPLPSIATSGPERSNRFSVKTQPIAPLTNLAPPVARSEISPLTDRHSPAQGTPVNVTAPLDLKKESGIGDESPISNLPSSSSGPNKRKNTNTHDSNQQSKRSKLDHSPH